MLDEQLSAKGRVHLLLTDQYGRVKVDHAYNNLVVNGGRQYIIDNMHEWTYTTTAVTSSVLTLANHGFHNGDEIIFTNLNGNTGLTATNTVYWVVSANGSAGTFQVSATEGGAAVTITGSANMTFRHKPNNVLAMALGTGSVAAAAADIGITETGIRKTGGALTVSKQGTNFETIRFVASWGAGESTGNIWEAGLFNFTASTGAGTAGGATDFQTTAGGLLLARTVFPGVITKGANDTLAVTWNITITASGT